MQLATVTTIVALVGDGVRLVTAVTSVDGEPITDVEVARRLQETLYVAVSQLSQGLASGAGGTGAQDPGPVQDLKTAIDR